MLMNSIHERRANQEPGYRVVATIGRHLLPQVRDALGPIGPSSVQVCPADIWTGALELSYRGQRVRFDREAARIEIACTEHQVDRVVRTIEAILAIAGHSANAAGGVLVLSVSSAHEASPRALQATG